MSNEALSAERLAEILAGCEGVTPGPWSYCEETCAHCEKEGMTSFYLPEVPDGVHAAFGEKIDAAHIANCDPQTVSALVSELLSAREAVDRLTADIKNAYAILCAGKPPHSAREANARRVLRTALGDDHAPD